MSTIQKNNTAVTTTGKPSALVAMASRLSVEPAKMLETLKATVFSKATNEEILALVVVANEYGLNPFLKELYAFPAKGGGIVPIVSVDGWNKMLVRQPDFDGIEFEDTVDNEGKLISCTATVYVKSRSRPVKITEYFDECKRNTEPWNNMPHRMLRNRTLCQAARVAFGFSGVKHEDEATDIAVEAIVTSDKQLAPLPSKIVTSDSKTPQAELETIVVTAGFTFDAIQKWGEDSGNIEGAGAMGSFAEIPSDVAKRLLKAQAGLLKGLEQFKVI